MSCCFGKNEEREPLLADKKDGADSEPDKESKKKPTKSTSLEFERLEVQEFDRVFNDFAQTLNPFVKDREKLEQAVAKFKTAVESIQQVRPHASFREYVAALKTKLKDEGIFIKIKNGAVEVYGVVGRSIKAVEDAVDAIKNIITASEALKEMPEVVTTASGSSIQDTESSLENIENIIKREFSGIFDICKVVRFKKNLKGNIKKMKNAPKMVQDFCQEVTSIVKDIKNAFDEENTSDGDQDNEGTGEVNDDNKNESVQRKQTTKKKRKTRTEGGKENEDEDKDEDKDEDVGSERTEKDKEKKKKGEKDKKNKKVESKEKKEKKEKKKEDYRKQLKMETVGLADIDKIFTDLMTSLNKFISTREKMQQARESFEKIMKTLSNFDGEKEFKSYVEELKEKAKQGKIQIYIDTNDEQIKLDSVKGVEPPAPYRNAVKALNDIKASAKETLDLEPVVERGIESCGKDITEIEPMKDFKKLVSGVKETMALPKKVKAFNENRKKVQQAPQIVKEFFGYVKQILADIVNAFSEKEANEKEDNSKEKEGSSGNGGIDEEDNKNSVEAVFNDPGKSTKPEKLEENSSAIVC